MDDSMIDPVIESPDPCEYTTEYENQIEADIIEIEPDEELEEQIENINREETGQDFARYERNYRARRIRELTAAPLHREGKRSKRASHKVAA
jgi:hypothetical protein